MSGAQQQVKSADPTTEPGLILLASPDDYLLEIERQDTVAAWIAANPGGETVALDPAPPPPQVVRVLLDRSLFSPVRLVVVPAGSPYFATKGEERGWGELLRAALAPLPFSDATLLITAVLSQEPEVGLVDLARERGKFCFLPTPAPPKPWEEDVAVSDAQRTVLRKVVARFAPAVAADAEVVEALCTAYGFKVRELVQAAQRLALSGEITPAAVRAMAGVGECSLQRLESALIERNRAAIAELLGRLAAGGALVDWRGEAVDPGGVGAVLTGMLGRIARNALAMRSHARRCDLLRELDPGRCAAQYWYGSTYKKRLHGTLTADAAQAGDSPIDGLSAWAAHRAFRFAAAYEEAELIELLGGLASSGVERAPAREAVPALTPLLLSLSAPRTAKPPAARHPSRS
jgi:hypothetical protein